VRLRDAHRTARDDRRIPRAAAQSLPNRTESSSVGELIHGGEGRGEPSRSLIWRGVQCHVTPEGSVSPPGKVSTVRARGAVTTEGKWPIKWKSWSEVYTGGALFQVSTTETGSYQTASSAPQSALFASLRRFRKNPRQWGASRGIRGPETARFGGGRRRNREKSLIAISVDPFAILAKMARSESIRLARHPQPSLAASQCRNPLRKPMPSACCCVLHRAGRSSFRVRASVVRSSGWQTSTLRRAKPLARKEGTQHGEEGIVMTGRRDQLSSDRSSLSTLTLRCPGSKDRRSEQGWWPPRPFK